MKKHQIIFNKIKELLKNRFSGELEEHDDGMYLSIGDSGIWISSDDQELTVGYGLVHQHYDPEYDSLEQAVEHFFNLLTCRVRRTDFYKGEFAYRHKIELELSNGNHDSLGSAMTWLFPYWKRTTKQVTFQDKLLNIDEIQSETYHNQETMHNK